MKGKFACCAFCLTLLMAISNSATAQVEIVSGPIGMDNQFVFPHASLPGATGINFSFLGAFAPMYPMPISHTVVINFEWGPTPTGPWTVSPDYVNTVPGGTTDFFGTGVFPGPDDAPFVAIHFYAGGLMIASGEFSHLSVVVPEPTSAGLFLCGLVSWFALMRDKWRC